MASQSENLLDNAGYPYNFDRMMFINRQTRKAFSKEFVEDRLPEEISFRIEEPTNCSEWSFYTSDVMTPGVERELKRVLQ